MTEEGARQRIRSILLAIDPSPDARAALEVVSRLAALLEAELQGLYVEDETLMRLPGGSLLREVDAVSGQIRPLESNELEQQLRAEAARTGRELARVADEWGVRWSFRVSRGKVPKEVSAAATESDLVTVGVRSHRAGRGLGSTARALVRETERPVMLIRRGMRLGDRVHVLDDGSDEARTAVALAEALTRRPDATLTIDVAGEPDDVEERLRAHRERLDVAGRREVRVQPVPPPGPGSTRPMEEKCGLLVLPRSQIREDVELDELLQESECPILVVG